MVGGDGGTSQDVLARFEMRLNEGQTGGCGKKWKFMNMLVDSNRILGGRQ